MTHLLRRPVAAFLLGLALTGCGDDAAPGADAQGVPEITRASPDAQPEPVTEPVNVPAVGPIVEGLTEEDLAAYVTMIEDGAISRRRVWDRPSDETLEDYDLAADRFQRIQMLLNTLLARRSGVPAAQNPQMAAQIAELERELAAASDEERPALERRLQMARSVRVDPVSGMVVIGESRRPPPPGSLQARDEALVESWLDRIVDALR